jgi:hypothetical protein
VRTIGTCSPADRTVEGERKRSNTVFRERASSDNSLDCKCRTNSPDPESQSIEKPQQASHFPTTSAFSDGNVPGLLWTFTRTFIWSGLNLTDSRDGVAFSPIEAKRLTDEIFQGVWTLPTGNIFDLYGKSGTGIHPSYWKPILMRVERLEWEHTQRKIHGKT